MSVASKCALRPSGKCSMFFKGLPNCGFSEMYESSVAAFLKRESSSRYCIFDSAPSCWLSKMMDARAAIKQKCYHTARREKETSYCSRTALTFNADIHRGHSLANFVNGFARVRSRIFTVYGQDVQRRESKIVSCTESMT